MKSQRPLTYSEYIRDYAIVAALDLPDAAPSGVPPQEWPIKPSGWQPGDDWPTGPHWVHDEVLFIRTHQAFEVWFALILHELGAITREAAALRTFEDPQLATRSPRPGPFDPSAWPKTAKLIAERMAADPGVAGPMAALGPPGSHHVTVAFPAHCGEGEEFYHDLLRWTAGLNRASKTLRMTLSFFDILATMPPAHFLKFRGRLQPASGFGSAQFREIEYVLGLREVHATKLRPDGGTPTQTPPLEAPTDATPSDQRMLSFYTSQTAWGRARVARRARETSLRDVVYGLLNAAYQAGSRPDGPETHLPDMRPAAIDHWFAACLQATLSDHYRGVTALDAAGREHLQAALAAMADATQHRETVAAALIDAHPERELFAAFLDACLELDQSLLLWRDRHLRFVEGMIGSRVGTGGGGLRYLGTTITARHTYLTHAFPCLWQARSFVQGV